MVVNLRLTGGDLHALGQFIGALNRATRDFNVEVLDALVLLRDDQAPDAVGHLVWQEDSHEYVLRQGVEK